MTARRILATLALSALVGCGSDGGPAGGVGGRGGGAGGRGGAAGGSSGGTTGAGGALGGTGGSSGGTTGAGGALGGTGGSSGGTTGAGGSVGGGSGAGTGGARGGASGTAGAAGGATGAGGSVGGAAGGNAGGGGSSGRGGGGGTSGATGTGGTSGGGGGGAGGGGSGGASGASGLKLEYATSSPAATLFDLRLTNLGPTTPLVSAIKLRYYFSDDSGQGTISPVFDLARWTISGATNPVDLRGSGGCSVVSTIRPIPTTSYADINCGLTSPLGVGDIVNFTIRFSAAVQNPSNDYSYADTGGTLAPNDHLLVIVNGVVVAGTPPS